MASEMGLRGRGRVRGGWRGGRSGRSSVPQTPSPPLGVALATIERRDLEDCIPESHYPVLIANTQYLTSYNWVCEGEQDIIVPGEPPAWTPLPKAARLRADSGVYFRDLNSARHPTHPLEPIIRAMLMENPGFCVKDLDIVGCGSTLGNLLRFAREKSPSFRVLIEVIGNTVFFGRRENSPKDTLQNVHGFGHTFPEAYTTWGENVRKSESHQRLINFGFGNMNCLVLFEADGYLPGLIPEDLKIQKDPISQKSHLEPEDLLSSFRGVTVSTAHPTTTENGPSTLRISSGGRRIPQCAIFDLKTRSAKKADIDILSEEMGRLWIRQIPNFVLAYHESGKFDDIRVQDVREEMKQWERSQQPALQRFSTLLQMVISVARSADDGKLEIQHDENEEVLNIRIPGGIVGNILPPALTEVWSARSGSDIEP